MRNGEDTKHKKRWLGSNNRQKYTKGCLLYNIIYNIWLHESILFHLCVFAAHFFSCMFIQSLQSLPYHTSQKYCTLPIFLLFLHTFHHICSFITCIHFAVLKESNYWSNQSLNPLIPFPFLFSQNVLYPTPASSSSGMNAYNCLIVINNYYFGSRKIEGGWSARYSWRQKAKKKQKIA